MALTSNISLEADINSKNVLNIDRLRNSYIVKDLNFIFKSPFFGYFEQQKDYLISESKLILMSPRYYMKPEYLSYDEYGTVVLAPIIMFINNCYSRMNFRDEEILVPSFDAIQKVISDAYDFFGQKIDTNSIEMKKIETLSKY